MDFYPSDNKVDNLARQPLSSSGESATILNERGSNEPVSSKAKSANVVYTVTTNGRAAEEEGTAPPETTWIFPETKLFPFVPDGFQHCYYEGLLRRSYMYVMQRIRSWY